MKQVAIKFCVAAALIIPSAAHAQEVATPPPAQLHSKSIFLGLGRSYYGERSYLYTAAYQAFSKAGYTLASRPSEAELAIEVSIDINSVVIGGDTAGRPIMQFTLFDTKTHSLLWTVGATMGASVRAASVRKDIDKGVDDAMTILTTLAAGKLPEK